MKFNSNSVLLNGGFHHKIRINIPDSLTRYRIPKKAWKKSIAEFNKILNKRPTVTHVINESPTDILNIELLDDNLLLNIVTCPDTFVEKKWFGIRGEVIFRKNSWKRVDSINIHNLVYEDAKGTIREVK